MKRQHVGMAVSGVLLLAGAAMAQNVPDYYIEMYDSYGTTGGGEFRAQIIGNPDPLNEPNPLMSFTPGRTGTNFQGPNGVAAASNRFETFCLERHETLQSPIGALSQQSGALSYKAQVRTYTQADANNASYSGNAHGGAQDSLNYMTAFLYTNFINGTLAGYDLNNATNRVTDANELQKAIWYIENESEFNSNNGVYDANDLALAQSNLSGEAEDFYELAHAAVFGGSWGFTLGNVRVLNLYTASTRIDYQSQLIMIPLPGGSGMATAGLACLFGVGYIRRRKQRTA